MAKVLPSDEALRKHYHGMDVSVDVPSVAGGYTIAQGSVTGIEVDGEDGCTLTVQVEIPLEDIPEM